MTGEIYDHTTNKSGTFVELLPGWWFYRDGAGPED
jgi:hypothetical protein